MPELNGLELTSIGGIAIAILFFGHKVLTLFAGQAELNRASQDRSTDALNRNTSSFEKMASVMEKSSERDQKHQDSVSAELGQHTVTLDQMRRKLDEVHGSLILRRRTDEGSDRTSEGGD